LSWLLNGRFAEQGQASHGVMEAHSALRLRLAPLPAELVGCTDTVSDLQKTLKNLYSRELGYFEEESTGVIWTGAFAVRSFLKFAALYVAVIMPVVSNAQGGPAGVATEVVAMRQMSETVSVFGEVVAGRESAVASRVAGIAKEVPIRVGALVKQGDVLARMDTERLEIDLSVAEANIAIAEAGIAVAEAQFERAEKALRRAENLRANSTIAEAQLDDRASDYAEAIGSRAEAMARITAARTARNLANYNLTNATIRAPFDGVVLQVATEVGQFVSAGSEVATLIDTSAMEVEANVPARFIDALSPQNAVGAMTDTGGALDLTLRAILPTEFSATRTRPVLFDINGAANVAVGQSVTLDVPVSAPRDVLVVPKDALVQARGGWSAFVNDAGKASPRTVVVGAALEDGFEVISGLVEGDEVVVRGNERLRPGQDIAPMGGGGRPPAAAEGGEGGPPADAAAKEADEPAEKG
jgi:RND family efflux transporter MFP subunit